MVSGGLCALTVDSSRSKPAEPMPHIVTKTPRPRRWPTMASSEELTEFLQAVWAFAAASGSVAVWWLRH
jgi:hypothetical protein